MEFLLGGVFGMKLVTNSSSVVYSEAISPDTLHDALDVILLAAGCGKKSRDVFDIYVTPPESKLKVVDEWLDEHLLAEHYEGIEMSWENREKIVERGYELVKAGIIPATYEGGGWNTYAESEYLVCLKDGESTEIGAAVGRLFSLEGSYDG